MGIYDRDYIRADQNSHNHFSFGPGQVCKYLIIANIALFILQAITRIDAPILVEKGIVSDWLILIPNNVLHGEIWRIATYGFLHSLTNPFHIVVNLLVLWFFGKEIENTLGGMEFLWFYILAITFGGIIYVLGVAANLHSVLSPCLGASGGVTAVLILYAFWFPSRTVLLFFVIPMPIWLLAVLFVAMDAFSLLTHSRQEIAVDVHLAGALFAFLYHRFNLQFTKLNIFGWAKKRKQPRLKIYREELPREVDETSSHKSEQLDKILEKISLYGQGSLTEIEKEILLRASEDLRKKKPW